MRREIELLNCKVSLRATVLRWPPRPVGVLLFKEVSRLKKERKCGDKFISERYSLVMSSSTSILYFFFRSRHQWIAFNRDKSSLNFNNFKGVELSSYEVLIHEHIDRKTKKQSLVKLWKEKGIFTKYESLMDYEDFQCLV